MQKLTIRAGGGPPDTTTGYFIVPCRGISMPPDGVTGWSKGGIVKICTKVCLGGVAKVDDLPAQGG